MKLQVVLTRILLPASAMLLLVSACDLVGKQRTYASPQEAVDALMAAVKSGNTNQLLRVLGKEAKPLFDSGDPVQDRNTGQRFVDLYTQSHKLATRDDGAQILEVGSDEWPFPFPLVQESGKWRFDDGEGVEEIVDRRVGRNELSAIQACLAYVDAQREYYARDPDDDPLLHYAQLLISTPGKRDGLYWEAGVAEVPSPLGPAYANARAAGYGKQESGKPQPFYGYYYRILKGQGSNAKGGAYDYIVHDRMIGGFGLIAYPADYGNSGVMTFVVNHDGVVFSKDLGKDTEKLAGEMNVFDPDGTWKREGDANAAPAG
ncbi:MAG TPA: DUF2950 domain-containing protein [Steroidobacteraceae bacterium]|nr:DUF2950 domain-containing protein [Steroidobacteraceae bacterium]